MTYNEIGDIMDEEKKLYFVYEDNHLKIVHYQKLLQLEETMISTRYLRIEGKDLKVLEMSEETVEIVGKVEQIIWQKANEEVSHSSKGK